MHVLCSDWSHSLKVNTRLQCLLSDVCYSLGVLRGSILPTVMDVCVSMTTVEGLCNARCTVANKKTPLWTDVIQTLQQLQSLPPDIYFIFITRTAEEIFHVYALFLFTLLHCTLNISFYLLALFSDMNTSLKSCLLGTN